jgi:steroid delta-isomerase-like uncharacterized protein
MSTDQNKARLRRVFEEGWNQGHLAVFDEVLAPDFLYHDPDAPTIRTCEDYKHYVTEIHRVFPDLHLTIEDVIAEGDQVVVRWTLQGTHTGNITTPMSLPATGKQVSMAGISIDRFAGGKVVESWQQGDTLGMIQQLGLLPVPGEAS